MPLAIIVKGNPRYIQDNPLAEAFYNEIADYLQAKGFTVEFDPGEPETSPREDAALWIGHSRGADRLQFAPPHVATLDLTPFEHPVAKQAQQQEAERVQQLGYDHLADVPTELRQTPPPEHYLFTEEMKQAIDSCIIALNYSS